MGLCNGDATVAQRRWTGATATGRSGSYMARSGHGPARSAQFKEGG
eukprot:CAMPEP_0185559506 /NCGR_PEP_ID=MMETSP1381-20130426/54712_1 /TAXON_ID=298111 /ORGANISM="Pavlova sp., Strain CCMP459" /LENGTH=45 /DNA_ID= /DNA_START= /DNA_END= /DNA_ORIENTATION=